jgi:hypothetical protein
MNWYKATLTQEHFRQSNIQNRFTNLTLLVPRPKKTFMYGSNNPSPYFELYFTPDCMIHMKKFLTEFNVIACERPNRKDVTGLVTIDDFEDLVW